MMEPLRSPALLVAALSTLAPTQVLAMGVCPSGTSVSSWGFVIAGAIAVAGIWGCYATWRSSTSATGRLGAVALLLGSVAVSMVFLIFWAMTGPCVS